MWRSVPRNERQEYLDKAIVFTGDAETYGKWMLEVIRKWPISCEHNLTDIHQNRRAWIGHAAVCLAFKCPEDITRQAWAYLTQDQQDRANKKADEAIHQWEMIHASKDIGLRKKMGVAGVQGWNTRSGRSEAGIFEQMPLL